MRSGFWLTRETIIARARVLVILNLILAAWGVWTLQRPPEGQPAVNVDFVSFYAAGALAREGHPELAYDHAAHAQAEAAATQPGRNYLYFFYPPPYLLLCTILAALPFALSFGLFELATFAAFAAVVRATAGPTAGWRLWLLPLLAFTPIYWSAGEGQNAFLTAALLGGALLVLDRRPLLAGLLIGLLCYKPHFGLLMPVALAFGGRWRAFAAAAGMVAVLVALSWWLYGTVTWQAYLTGFLGSGEAYGSGAVSYIGMVNLYGAARLVGVPVGVAVALQGVAGVGGAGIVAWVWRSNAPRAVRSATLLAATMVALPLVLLYDQTVTLLAVVWLARAGAFPPWEKSLLALAFLLPIVGVPMSALGIPLAPLPALILVALCVRRRWAEAHPTPL